MNKQPIQKNGVLLTWNEQYQRYQLPLPKGGTVLLFDEETGEMYPAPVNEKYRPGDTVTFTEKVTVNNADGSSAERFRQMTAIPQYNVVTPESIAALRSQRDAAALEAQVNLLRAFSDSKAFITVCIYGVVGAFAFAIGRAIWAGATLAESAISYAIADLVATAIYILGAIVGIAALIWLVPKLWRALQSDMEAPATYEYEAAPTTSKKGDNITVNIQTGSGHNHGDPAQQIVNNRYGI